jgi:photosystem II stability/assembly factor-like uncharacterized protein
MKKHLYIWTIGLSLAMAGLVILNQSGYFNVQKNNATMPSGANEENGRLRRAWQKMRLADPATGDIPVGITWLERQFAEENLWGTAERNLTATWQSRGPWNVGGRTRSLVMDVTDPNHLFAGGVSGGIWESTDGGQSWTRRTPMNAHPGVVSIAQDTRPGHTNTWYYLSGEIYGTSASAGGAFYLGDGLYKSVDNGQTWTGVTTTNGGNPNSFTTVWQGGWRVITDPTAPDNQDVVYVATYGVIWKSTNGGTSFSAVRGSANAANPSYFTDVAITSTGVLYAAMSSEGSTKGIWRSPDAGVTWTNITPSAGFPGVYDRWVFGIDPNDENNIWIIGSTPGFGHYNNYIDSDDYTSLWRYKYVSGNGAGAGGEWADLSMNLPNIGTEFDRFACQGGYDLVVKVQPGTGNVFIGGTNLYRSTDAFTTPDNITQIGGYKIGTSLPFFELYPAHHPDQHDLLFHPNDPKIMLSAHDGGLHRTEDCNAPIVTWTPLNRGYQTTQFYTAIIEKSTAGDATIIGGLQDNGNFFTNSTNPTAIWKQTVNGDGAYGAIPDGKSFYILSIQQGRVAKCDIAADGTVNAFRRIDPIGRNKGDYLFINPLAMDPTDQNILYLPAGNRLYRQDQLAQISLTGEWDSIAQGWTQYPDTLTPIANGVEHAISAIGVSEANPAHTVYVGTTRNKIYRIDNAHQGAPNWTALPSPSSATGNYINCIAVDPENANDVTVLYSNYGIYSLYRSINGGQNWSKIAGNLEQNFNGGTTGPSLRWFSILPFPNGERRYFCGTSVGLYATDTLIVHTNTNPGTQWTLQAPDLIGASVVDHIETRASDGLVVVATHGIGMFSANFDAPSSTNSPTTGSGIQVRMSPNPVRDRLFFNVKMPHATLAQGSIQLYSAKGVLVRQERLEQGQSGQIDMAGLTPGIYFWQASARGFKQTGKVVKLE